MDKIPAAAKDGRSEPLTRDEIGPLHLEVVRFVDDICSVIAQFGNRCQDHLSRVRHIIRRGFGNQGLNLVKQGEEGEPSNFKHAFGVVVDALERTLQAPWSKMCKLHDLVINFVNGSEQELEYGQVTKIRGVANHVLFCAPGQARQLMPRLDAMLSDASNFMDAQGHIPLECHPSPQLQGETRAQGFTMLRRVLNLVLRLALIDRGKLFRITFEMAQPRWVRESWPGKEGPEARVDFLMDASGTGLYLIDLATGEEIRVRFSEAEQELFNKWEREHDVTDINQRETLSELFGAVLCGRHHPRKMINMINDNTSAESWTCYSRHSHARIDHILSILGLCELLLRQTIVGSRVTTDRNFADTGTRDDKQSDYVVGIKELEKKHGWKAKEVANEETMPHWTAPNNSDRVSL